MLIPPGLASLALGLASLTDSELLRAAEEAFHAGVSAAGKPEELDCFRRSAELYDELRERGHASPALYQNQGNAYFLADELPEAILAYRRGLRLAPNDPGLQAALAEARGRVLYPSPSFLSTDGNGADGFARPAREPWPAFLPHPSLGMLLGLTVLCYAGVCLGVARWFMVRRRRPLVFALFMLAVTAAFSAATVVEIHARVDTVEHPLVVIARDDVVLRKGNGLSYPRRSEPPLNKGVEARLLSERAGWLHIELGSGEAGWVPAAAALVDRD
jgi:hypothetical protein